MGIAGALLLAAAHALNLIGAAYARYAESRLDRAGDPSVAAAASLAADLTPWSERRHALAGWVATKEGRDEEAQRHYTTALRWAPAEPLIWTEYALSRARNGRFDEALRHAIKRAQTLAPHSPAVHDSIAAIGVNYWQRGTDPLQALWLLSMRYERDYNRQTFLGQVVARGQARTFCREAGPRLGEEQWCAVIQGMVERCRGEGGATEQSYSLCVTDR